ncbi:MAG: ankyrin repeat domain-containing protein [Cocleimonas sp.]
MHLITKVVLISSSWLIHSAIFANESQQEQELLRQYALLQAPQVIPQKVAYKKVAYKKPVPQYQPPPAPATPQQIPDAGQLFAAALNGDVNQVGRLLSQGIDINVGNRERETALHMAASRGHYSTVIFLIKNGAYIHARTVKNWFPLHHAVRFRHANIANYLVQHGASPHARTSDGLSAIDMASNVNDLRLLSILGGR